MQRREDLFALLLEFWRWFVAIVDFFPEVGSVVCHVCRFEEIVLCLHEVFGGVHVFLREEFEERKDELSVEKGDEFLREIIFLTLPVRISSIVRWEVSTSS